jgi:hypothetical protein
MQVTKKTMLKIEPLVREWLRADVGITERSIAKKQKPSGITNTKVVQAVEDLLDGRGIVKTYPSGVLIWTTPQNASLAGLPPGRHMPMCEEHAVPEPCPTCRPGWIVRGFAAAIKASF